MKVLDENIKKSIQKAFYFGYNVQEICADLDELKEWVKENNPRKPKDENKK